MALAFGLGGREAAGREFPRVGFARGGVGVATGGTRSRSPERVREVLTGMTASGLSAALFLFYDIS